MNIAELCIINELLVSHCSSNVEVIKIVTIHKTIKSGRWSGLSNASSFPRGHAGQVSVAVRLGRLVTFAVALYPLVASEHRHPLLAPVL